MIRAWVLSETRGGELVGPPRIFTFQYQIERMWAERFNEPLGLRSGETRRVRAIDGGTLYLDRVELPGRVAIPDEVVREVRDRYYADERPSTTRLGREYGISQTMVSAILRGARRGQVD